MVIVAQQVLRGVIPSATARATRERASERGIGAHFGMAETLGWSIAACDFRIPNMPSSVQFAVSTYIRAVCKCDREARGALFDACLADDVRMVTRGREIRGRAQIAEELNRFLADPQLLRVRVTSAVDTGEKTFRYRAVADFRNGMSAEAFDAGEVDETGRIALILTFAGPLGEAVDESILEVKEAKEL